MIDLNIANSELNVKLIQKCVLNTSLVLENVFVAKRRKQPYFPLYQKNKSNLPIIKKQRPLPLKEKFIKIKKLIKVLWQSKYF